MVATSALLIASPPAQGLDSISIGHSAVGWVFIPVLLWCCSSHMSINTMTPGLPT